MTVAEPQLVSIVVPVHNGERYLRESLDSILAQDYARVEVILMDDASTDATAAIAASYEGRVSTHRQPERRGQFGNVNDGIAKARGDLIAVYHSDDVYRRELVTREVDYLRDHPEVGAVFCRDIYIDEDGTAFGANVLPSAVAGGAALDYPAVLNALLTYKNVFLRCPSAMVHASVYREVGPYRPEFGIAADLEMWLRIARRHRLGIIDEALFAYRRGHGSSSDQYFQLRVDPETHFEIMDLELRGPGAGVARPESLAAHEAHRAEDDLKRAIGHYILGRRRESQAILSSLSALTLLRSPHVQRVRLAALLSIMRCVAALPPVPLAATMLRRRTFERCPAPARRSRDDPALKAPSTMRAEVTLFIDPPSYHFERDRLFDLRTAQFGGADVLAPYLHLRRRLSARGVRVHTADRLDRGEGLSERNVYVSLGLRGRYKGLAAREDVIVSALLALECPIVDPELYRALPEASAHFERILSYSTTPALLPFTGAPVEVQPFRIPQSFDSVDGQIWPRTDRRFLVMINGNKVPRLDVNELYSERMRAVEFFDRTGEIDLYGIGWGGPPYRVGTRLPGLLQRGVRAFDVARHRIRPEPLLAAAQHAWRGRVEAKAQVLGQYRFAICFENMALEGCITEKLFDCLFVGTVPVYLGAPDIERWVPRECFIDMRDFEGYPELRAYLRSLGDRGLQAYRDAARDFICSDAYRPFSKDTFAEVFERLLVEDAAIPVA